MDSARPQRRTMTWIRKQSYLAHTCRHHHLSPGETERCHYNNALRYLLSRSKIGGDLRKCRYSREDSEDYIWRVRRGESCEALNIFCVCVGDVAEWGLANQQICSICFLERRGKGSLSTEQLLKKRERERKDKDSWQVLGFRDPLHECRENSHLRLHRIHHSCDFMVVELFYIANKLPYYNLCKLVFSQQQK